MYRIDTPDAVASVPAPAGLGTEGYWTHGNPGTGEAATTLDQDWLNALQENLIAFLIAAGIAHSKSDHSRLWQALLRLGAFQDTGSANHLIAGPPAGVTFDGSTIGLGTTIKVKVAVTNTGAVDFTWAGGAALGVSYPDGSAIGAGDFPAGAVIQLVENGGGAWTCLTVTPPAVRRLATILPISLDTNTPGGSSLQVTGKLPVPNAPTNILFTQFTDEPPTINFTVPNDTYWIYAECQAAGGSGAGSGVVSGQSGGGGGAGEYRAGWIAVTPGQVIPLTIGGGGFPEPINTDGQDGGSSSVGSFITSVGGTRGFQGASASGGSGGAGGSGGQIFAFGGDGTAGQGPPSSYLDKAGDGGCSYFGGGSLGSTVGDLPPRAPGSGGGGGYGSGGGGNLGSGSPGQDGCIIIWG